MFNIVVFNSENELLLEDIKNECQNQKWVPIACLENLNDKTIFVFNNIEIARNFAKRNFGKSNLIGLILLHEIEINKLKDSYKLEELNWPKKIKNIKFEIINLEEVPKLMVG